MNWSFCISSTQCGQTISQCDHELWKEATLACTLTHTCLQDLARNGEIIARLHYKHFVPTKALCKFNQSTDSGHGDSERLNDLLIRATCLHHQSSQSRNITQDLIPGIQERPQVYGTYKRVTALCQCKLSLHLCSKHSNLNDLSLNIMLFFFLIWKISLSL